MTNGRTVCIDGNRLPVEVLAQLMVAKATGESIVIGYDNAGDCAHGYIRVHRIG